MSGCVRFYLYFCNCDKYGNKILFMKQKIVWLKEFVVYVGIIIISCLSALWLMVSRRRGK